MRPVRMIKSSSRRAGRSLPYPDHPSGGPGIRNASWAPAVQRGTDVVVVKFAGEAYQPCPVKARCTTATRGGRQLTLRPRPVQEALDQARAGQSTTGWQRRYARRAGVESTIAQAVKVTNARRTRYRGLPTSAWNTTPWPRPSTSSASTPGSTARPSATQPQQRRT